MPESGMPQSRTRSLGSLQAAGLVDRLIGLGETAEGIGIDGLRTARGHAFDDHAAALDHGRDQGGVGFLVRWSLS